MCKPQCRHIFIIEPPNGPTSKGVCLKCGKKDVFKNSSGSNNWKASQLSRKLRGRLNKQKDTVGTPGRN